MSASAPVPIGPEPWERAANWLTALGIMPSVEGICKPELFDFIVFLENGVVLCEAINAIFPAKVEHGENPIETMWQKQNIDNFLAACSELELPAENLFDAEDLNDGNDVHSVFKTLASLSQLEAAQAKGIAGFEITEAPKARSRRSAASTTPRSRTGGGRGSSTTSSATSTLTITTTASATTPCTTARSWPPAAALTSFLLTLTWHARTCATS